MKALIDLIQQHKQGHASGIYAVCSAHPLVLEAALTQAKNDDQLVLIEATSNQVNQDGGYTGMQPQAFVDFVYNLADSMAFDRNKILLGGDHLGPNCWQALSAEQAMAKSDILIRDYVLAGFRKIHLDCSMPCAGDPTPLTDEIIAQRAARLCDIAEHAWQQAGGEAPVYVIGTEVPVPGGAQHDMEDTLAVTTPTAAKDTIDAHYQAFKSFGLTQVWSRVIGLVVQPGVEFDHHNVAHYQPNKALKLSEFIESQPHMVFEAHSTDYQCDSAYQHLVRDHFAILKVGPALTFALREALFALDRIEQEWLGSHQASHLRATLEQVMREQPNYWQSYYQASGHQQYLDCAYSLSDRIRYYWPHPQVQQALSVMMDNLTNNPAPITLLSQYMANQAKAVIAEHIINDPKQLIIHKVMEVTQVYAQACYFNALAPKETVL